MKTNGKKTHKSEPFQHAADLPAAYRELQAAIEAQIELRDNGPLPFHRVDVLSVTSISLHATWTFADAHAAALQRVGAAARRVQVALVGQKDAQRWDGFKAGRAA
jgi:hypothetical protein